MAKIAIIDDDLFFQEVLAENCQLLGHETFSAGSIREAKGICTSEPLDLVFLDVRLPDGNGLEMLPQIRNLPSGPEVIIITGMGDTDGAQLAINNGAWDYLQKPLSYDEITLQVKRALEYHDNKKRTKSYLNLKRDGIIGKSPSLCKCLDQVASCAGTDTTVLLTGETGTGKELFARAIHDNSKRANGPFIIVDCASLPSELVESLLFGHVKGAFTGATKEQRGLVEQANGGTLFLDEVGELPIDSQKTFLRVLQEKTYRPIGHGKQLPSNFRLIAATNRSLEAMVDENNFRGDLYYRLNGFTIQLPPLRNRQEDIEKLAMTFIFSICRREKIPVKGIVPDTLEALLHYNWPGNAREFKQVLEKAILEDMRAPIIFPMHLPPEVRLNRIYSQITQKRDVSGSTREMPTQAYGQGPEELPEFREYKKLFQRDLERHYLQRLMQKSSGNITEARRISGLSRSRLYDLLKSHSLLPFSS